MVVETLVLRRHLSVETVVVIQGVFASMNMR